MKIKLAMRRAFWSCFALLILVITSPVQIAHAQTAKTNMFLDGSGARLQTLNKITARIDELDLALNRPVRFGTLEITLFHCAYKPPEEPPEHAAFIKIQDLGYSDNASKTVFSGWMFASSPAVSSLEHAVYDVSVIACTSE